MTFERLEKKYVPAVANIEREAMDEPWSEKMLLDELENPFTVFLAGIEGGELLSYAAFRYTLDEGDILNVAVRGDHRAQGLGKETLSALLNEAKRLGVRKLTLEVREDNIPAIRLYTSFGFRREGIRKKYYQNSFDAILMTLELGEEKDKK